MKEVIGVAISVLIFVLGIFKYLYSLISNLNKRLDGMVTMDMCSQKYSWMKEKAGSVDTEILNINSKLDNLTIMLTRIDTTIKILAKKNGALSGDES